MATTIAKMRVLSAQKMSLFLSSSRALSTTPICKENQGDSGRWFSKLLVRRIEPTKESHSRMLSDKEIVFEMNTHHIKPPAMENYLKNYHEHVKLVQSRKEELHCDLVGSWKVVAGEQDQVLHLWRYTGGYASIDAARKIVTTDPDFTKLASERLQFLRSRYSQYLLAFSYWPPVLQRDGDHIYEIRSYTLKPGTMIEWGNNWARAIHYRKHNEEAYGGFFSQVGRLYNVHHMWCYDNLQVRKETREEAWRKPGWDECVAYTVPLIREMDSRILVPTSFSPSK